MKFIEKIAKIPYMLLMLYVACLLFIRGANMEKEIDSNFFYSTTFAFILSSIAVLFLFYILGFLVKIKIIKNARVSLFVELVAFLTCALFLKITNLERPIDADFLPATCLLWTDIQPVIILPYFIFRWINRSLSEPKITSYTSEEEVHGDYSEIEHDTYLSEVSSKIYNSHEIFEENHSEPEPEPVISKSNPIIFSRSDELWNGEKKVEISYSRDSEFAIKSGTLTKIIDFPESIGIEFQIENEDKKIYLTTLEIKKVVSDKEEVFELFSDFMSKELNI